MTKEEIMKIKKPFLNIVKNEIETFEFPASYEFIMVGKIKIETVNSFVKRGGEITYVGNFSCAYHCTNNPNLRPVVQERKNQERTKQESGVEQAS